MQTTGNGLILHIFIERDDEPTEEWNVTLDGTGGLVATDDSGQALPFRYVANDFMIGPRRFRFVQVLPDKEWVAVPYTDDMDAEEWLDEG